jgi:hypothetical protein
MPLIFSGQEARVAWGYHTAATLRDWQVTVDKGTPDEPKPVSRVLTATVVSRNPVAVTQRPLTLVVPRPGPAWRWPIGQLEITDDGALHATLGPKERSDVSIRAT